jgi:Mg-chelatase subunit ChlD
MRGLNRVNSLGIAALAGLSLGGCVRYYAGVGYASTWQAPRTTVSSPPVLVVENGAPTAWVSGSTATTLASSAEARASSVGGGDVGGASSGVATMGVSGVAAADGTVSASGAAASASAEGTGVVLSLGGLCGGGAPTDGGIARLGDLHALPSLPSAGAQLLHVDANVRVSASLAHDALPVSGGRTSVVVEVEGLAPPAVIAPLRVHLVIDASTSMEGAWEDVKQAALAVVRRLRPEDELQIVVYGTSAREVLAPVPIGDGREAREVIRGMRFGGRTNIESGLRLAYEACRPAGRSLVIVVSDGVPQGGLSGADELGGLAAEANASEGAVTLAIGLGTEFHTGILSAIGERGGGELLLAPRSTELALLLERTLAARGAIVASDLDVELTAQPGVRLAGEGRLGAGALSAGETRTFVVPIETVHTGALAHLRFSLTLADGRALELEASLSLGEARAPVPAGSIGAVLDASLAEALRAASTEIESGRGAAAAELLRAHAASARALVPSPAPALEARNEAVLRVATVLPQLVAEASWGARRQAAAAFVARALDR